MHLFKDILAQILKPFPNKIWCDASFQGEIDKKKIKNYKKFSKKFLDFLGGDNNILTCNFDFLKF
jgi:hypothetical protein